MTESIPKLYVPVQKATKRSGQAKLKVLDILRDNFVKPQGVYANLCLIYSCCRFYKKFCSKWFPPNPPPGCLGANITESKAQKCSIKIRDDLVDPWSRNQTLSYLKEIEIAYSSAERSRPGAEQELSEAAAAAGMSPDLTTEDINKDILEIDQFLLDGTMFHDSALNCENFQDLRLWCSDTPSEDTIGTDFTKTIIEDTANMTTSPTLYPPQAWGGEENGVGSPIGQGSFFTTTPLTSIEILSPASDVLTSHTDQMFSYRSPEHSNLDKEMNIEAEFFDVSNIPVVLGRDESPYGSVPLAGNTTHPSTRDLDWADVLRHDTSKYYTQQHNIPAQNAHKEDSISESISWSQNVVSAYPDPISSYTPMNDNETVISEYILTEVENKITIKSDVFLPYNSNQIYKNKDHHLRLNVKSKPATKTVPEGILSFEPVMGTPDLLNCVEQLEAEKFGPLGLFLPKSDKMETTQPCTPLPEVQEDKLHLEFLMDFEPLPQQTKEEPLDSDEDRYHHTPAVKRRRRHSEDSDETYTPYTDKTPTKKHKKRKATLIIPSEEPKKVKRGRPPKRRESLVSACTTDDNTSCVSVEEGKYRELRDKNNEASKRSRMNRKQKETEMEEMGVQLEERNKKLRVKAEILEELTKKLKDALLSAILQN